MPAGPAKKDYSKIMMSRYVPWVMLAVLLGLAVWLAGIMATERDGRVELLFERHRTALSEALVNRIRRSEILLWSGSALFLASDQVSDHEWAIFGANMQESNIYPALVAAGFAPVEITSAAKDGAASPGERFEARIKFLFPQNDVVNNLLDYNFFCQPRVRACGETRF